MWITFGQKAGYRKPRRRGKDSHLKRKEKTTKLGPKGVKAEPGDHTRKFLSVPSSCTFRSQRHGALARSCA
jgi:hypothetical protein